MRTLLVCLALIAVFACDDPRPRFDPDRDAAVDADLVDEGAPDASSRVDAAPPDPDAGLTDAALADVGAEDAAPPDLDAAVDATDAARARDAGPTLDVGPSLDGGLDPDSAIVVDGGLDVDAAPEADAGVDRGLEPDAAVLGGFITGVALAADGRTPVDVAAGDLVVQTNAAGAFRIGPLAAGPVTLRIAADRHQALTRDAEVPARGDAQLDEAVLLYRGRRIGPAADAQLRFSGDDAWIVWSQGDALWRRGTAAGDQPLALLPAAFEVFLGFVPGAARIAIRRRAEVGLAGDIEVIGLDAGERLRLFTEAQPWVRWRGDQALGMTGTRDGLSTLALGTPGEAAQILGEGVPWLLVTELADGSPAWAQQRDDDAGFDIWRGGVVQPAEPISGRLPASNAYLSTTPGRTGLLWLGPDGALTRWEPDADARVLAEDVIPSPRPRFLAGERMLFWRADVDEPGLEHLFVLDADGERSLIDGVDGNSLRVVGDRYYIVRPDDGLYTADLDGEPARLIAGDRVQFTTQGPGLIALVDGAAYTAVPDGQVVDLEIAGLTSLQGLNVGATAWQADGGRLWWIPGPAQAAPPAPLVEGAARARRIVERGNAAVYPLGADGYFRAPIPPAAPTRFAAQVSELTSLSADLAVGYSPDAWLYGIDPRSGDVTGWAPVVSRVVVSGSRRLVAYVSDRGTFLVDLTR